MRCRRLLDSDAAGFRFKLSENAGMAAFRPIVTANASASAAECDDETVVGHRLGLHPARGPGPNPLDFAYSVC